MPQGLQQGETLEPLNGFPPPSMPDVAGASHPSLREGETLEPIAQPNYAGRGDSSQIGHDTGFVHGLIRGGRNIVHTAKEFGSDLANPDMPVALSDRPGDQGSVAARMQGDTMLNKYVLGPAAQEKQRSLEEADAMHRTSGLESLGHGLTSMVHTAGEFVPVAGPLIGSLVDRGREGDISGAVGEGATYALAPRIARGVGGKAVAAARDIPGLREVVPSVEGAGITIGKSRLGPAIGRAVNATTSSEEPAAPPTVSVAAAAPVAPRGLRAGACEAPASPLSPQPQLGEGVHEGEYMEDPPPVIRGQLQRGAIPQRGGFEPNQPALPAIGQPIRLPAEFPPARQPVIRTTPSAPLEPLRTREIAGLHPSNRPIGAIPAESVLSSNWPPEAEDYPRLVNEMKGQASPELRRPVTENPVVGSLVRAMQKSGLPIAERPNLLLKGSGRVNRIMGPDEDLSGALTDSLRQARRQMKQ